MNDDVMVSSGNVFADLGLPDPEIRQVKAEIASRISDVIEERKLTQVQAAQILGIDQPKVSALVRGKLSGFTLDRLLRFLNDLDVDVEIRLTPAKGKAHTAVAA
ncbi:helix-turn-helix transcriptional regulator [Nitrospirillum amazonense]|uniref:Putative XRE-type DNA-binding protein n=1 Tax=Nitrospirillum amazonense TaxID=28077 RepID=A0A560KKQ7_9PROT|nr:helix-turn-helix transcriptional regulator [Nitrospirillum amazonense]MEC4589413.1 helix-turn-helix transcriptional regulator [Nitrospirillum amazonense]TWB82684.1 putative XRE-type DNA-binding protein [Nitrospirillum amazonense]